MRVSDLLRYRNDIIDTLDHFNLTVAVEDTKQHFTRLVTTHPHDIGHNILRSADDEFSRIVTDSIRIKNSIIPILDDINVAVDSLATQNFTDAELKFYNFCQPTDITISDNVIDAVTACINHNADFYYPGILFGCNPHNTPLLNSLVANDPFYLCDFDSTVIDTLTMQFNDAYARRVRKYIIENNNTTTLPQNQFGFILSWMLFNYANITCITEYLKKMIALLRPGGSFLFSYNNCDILESCELAEKGIMKYVTKRQLVDICKGVGYEIVKDYDVPNDDPMVKYISWIEIKKPGNLTTTKRRQVMGEIKHK